MAAPNSNKGYKSDKQWREAIMLAVHRLATDGKTKHLDLLAMRLVKSGVEGDVAAMREIGDRLDGKPTQDVAIEHTGEITHKSAAISAVDELTSFAFTGSAHIADADPLPN